MSERITRQKVATMLDVSLATVRRMEGHDLHPDIVDGVRIFSLDEVNALKAVRAAAGKLPATKMVGTKYKPASKLKSERRLRKYALLPSEYETLLQKQQGRCAICAILFFGRTIPCIDHDHRSGMVRGILCAPCNVMLGNAKDEVVVLRKAIEYLAAAKRREREIEDV